MAEARAQSGAILGNDWEREGERRSRRRKKEGFDIRNASIHRESETEERKRRNQESRCGEERERGCEGLRRREREWEVEERRDSRRRDWEGRRVRSLWERKECAVCVTLEINAARFWWFEQRFVALLWDFLALRFAATMPVKSGWWTTLRSDEK